MRNLAYAIALALLPAIVAQTQPSVPQESTVRAIRLKLSAGDLASAESLLEQHKAETGMDSAYIVGLSWLARGGALLRDWPAAEHYSALTRDLCAHSKDPDAIYALGSAIEVHAQVLEAQGNKQDAIAFLDEQAKAYKELPTAFRSRLYKRRNLIGLVGQPASAITSDDNIAGPALNEGKPTVLFLWANYCGDCLSQSAALGRFWQKYRGRGLRMLAVTRIYDDDAAKDKAKTASVWQSSYQALADVPVSISTEAMVRYGGSSTPAFVFIDGHGIVRAYLPYRLTEQRLGEEAEKLLR